MYPWLALSLVLGGADLGLLILLSQLWSARLVALTPCLVYVLLCEWQASFLAFSPSLIFL